MCRMLFERIWISFYSLAQIFLASRQIQIVRQKTCQIVPLLTVVVCNSKLSLLQQSFVRVISTLICN